MRAGVPGGVTATVVSAAVAAVVAVAAFSLGGCAGAAGPAPSRGPGAGGGVGADEAAGVVGEWRRVVAPFEVRDSAGAAYEHPFLGGFDVPRPQLIDIDDDGDPDLFLQERSGEIMFLENVGTPASPRFVWRTDRFGGLDVHEWYRFADMDQDGDFDLLAEEPFSHVAYFRNDGTAAEPRFVRAADTLRTVDGAPLFSDRQNIPNATDLDCDGLMDLFVGRLTGTVMRYEAVEAGSPVPVFRLLTERFGDIEIVAAQMGSMRHGANTMDFADHDGDGDADLFWGDFFEPGLLLLENTGSCRNPVIRNTPVPFPPGNPVRTTGYNAPSVADLNADGRPDMLIGVLGGAYNPTRSAHENLYYLEHAPTGFELRTRGFLSQLDLGSEVVPALVDDDGDGDLDLLVGAKIDPDQPATARIHRYENTGTPGSPAFRWTGVLPVSGSYHYAPESGDLDGDGRPDLVVGTWNDDILYYRNAGPAGTEAAAGADTAAQPGGAPGGEAGGVRWTLEAEPLVELTRGSNSTPALGDIDGDGDLDLFVGEASGTLNLYRNEGSPRQPRFELVSDAWEGVDVGRRSHPALVDLDGDGDLDLVVGNEDGELRLFRNRGTARAARWTEEAAPLPRLPYVAPAFGDLDGDGRSELLLGGLSGGITYYTR